MKISWLSIIVGNVSSIAFYQNNSESSTSHRTEFVQLYETFSEFVTSPNLFYNHLLSAFTEALEHILYVCLVYLIVCLGIYKFIFSSAANWPNTRWRSLRNYMGGEHLPPNGTFRRVLLVTSHPDDECMFFGPLVYSLTQRKDCQVYVLCLSNGNFENKSHMRREELWQSCNMLGIPSSNIILINATHLPDDPNVEWKTNVVANLILNTVEVLDIQAIVTFDRDGVSQHPNHCAVYFAAASLSLANLLPTDCKFYTLDTVNIFRKYLSVFDLFCTCIMSTHWCVLNWKQAAIIRSAMKEHKSQMKWFRWLYIYCSRYMFINSMREINLSDVELEMQIEDN